MVDFILHIGTEMEFVRLTYPRRIADPTFGAFRAEVRCGEFFAAANCEEHPVGGGVYRLKEQLGRLARTLEGEARFEPVGQQLVFTMRPDRRGRLDIRGVLHQNELAQDTSLHFTIRLDQTFLPDIVAQLSKLEA
jgi:hypothetical protein